jgi:vesicle-fusing ATPase
VRDLRELSSVLDEAKVFDSREQINSALNNIQSYSGSEEVGVGIKAVLTLAESARLAGGDPCEWFAEQMCGRIQRNNPRV